MNRVELVGRLTADPVLNSSDSGVSNCNFTLAVRKEYKPKDGEPDSYFIRCVAWRQSAEYLCNYGAKGRMVGLVGSLQPRMYEKDGVKHYPTDVVAIRLELLGGSGNDNPGDTEPGHPAAGSAPVEDDEDLPF